MQIILVHRFFSNCCGLNWGRAAKLVQAVRPKTGGSGFNSRWGPWKFSRDPFLLSAFSSPVDHPACNRKEYQGLSLGVKCGRRVELTNLRS